MALVTKKKSKIFNAYKNCAKMCMYTYHLVIDLKHCKFIVYKQAFVLYKCKYEETSMKKNALVQIKMNKNTFLL